MRQSDIAASQFGSVAAAYLTSSVHAQGADLQALAERVAASGAQRVLDIGCGAGHASYTVARCVREVCAYDVSDEMLEVVAATAQARGLHPVRTQRGVAESLPFADASFDGVISRFSAHHWRDVQAATREMRRVLAPGGLVIVIDSMGASDPLCDTHLQTIELLRDRSHVRNYNAREWQRFLADAGFHDTEVDPWRTHIEFASWIARMRTPPDRVSAIRQVWEQAPTEVRDHFRVAPDGSFELEVVRVSASRCG